MMNKDSEIDIDQLRGEIEAVSARLQHARRSLGGDEDEFIKETCARIDRCAGQIAQLSPKDRPRMQPLLLAILDEVDRTMKAFNAALVCRRRELASSDQGRVAGAAYRRAQNSNA